MTFHAPTAASIVSGSIRATYPAGVAVAGSIYQIASPPTGIMFAQGTCALPQVGTVITAQQAAVVARLAKGPKPARPQAAQRKPSKAKASAYPRLMGKGPTTTLRRAA